MKTELKPGLMVKFTYPTSEARKWWDVRVCSERFAVLTRQAEFKPKGKLFYTIIDWERSLRGPCNLIGQGWSEDMSDEDCRELLAALSSGEVEVSYRNNVPIEIGETK